jgi:hypothetical protein
MNGVERRFIVTTMTGFFVLMGAMSLLMMVG